LKVLHVIPGVSERDGGPSQAATQICNALIGSGQEVLLLTTAPNDHGDCGKGVPVSFQDVPTVFFPARFGKSFKYSSSLANWLESNVSQFDLVHIHAVFNHSSYAAARACRASGVPYIVRPLGTLGPWAMKQKTLRKKLFWHAAAKQMLQGAAAVHYTSETERQAVEQSLHLRRGFVVPLGVHLNNGANTAVSIKHVLPGLEDKAYVLVLSRLLPTKGIATLLDAFLSLLQRKEFMNWRLVLAGDGPPEFVDSLKRKVGESLAGDFVRFTGWLDGERKDGALRNASLLALPSHHENFGLCVMEALAYGVPVLVSPQVDLSAEIFAEEAGWIAEINKDSLEQALAVACSSESERARRGQAGLKLAQKFDWKVIAERLSEVYEEVIAENGKGRRSTKSH